MKIKRKPIEDVALEAAITRLYDQLALETVNTDDYNIITDQLTKLYALRDITTPKRVSPDTLAMIGANIVGIGMIVGFERANVITSKAMAFIRQAR